LGLDLVEVAPDARPPVVRLMDYGKFKYEQSVRAREARKKQTRTVIKEVQFRPKIGGNDFDVKRRRVQEFLDEGDKVKVTMRFRGREVTHPEIGREILERLVSEIDDHGEVEVAPKMEGRSMTMLLVPVKRRKEEAAESDADGTGGAEEGEELPDAEPVDAEPAAASSEEIEGASDAETEDA
jgi:translation initiation factor IF-3